MALATVKSKTVIEGVTLELTKAEAVFLRALLGNTHGNSVNSAEKYSTSIFVALKDKVPFDEAIKSPFANTAYFAEWPHGSDDPYVNSAKKW